jgi:hypothetical protein
LGRSTFGVFFDIVLIAGPLHGDLKVDQITVKQPGFDALIDRGKHALGGQFRCGASGQQDQRGKPHRAYSAAIRGCARALALADNSAINAEARAMGLVR